MRRSWWNPRGRASGYKMVKWIECIEFIESEKLIGKGQGGKNEDDEYFDLLPNI
jgi:sulfoxide reductase catalytic subunit YedY